MKSILLVSSSPRGANSYSHQFAGHVIADLTSRHPEARLVVRDVAVRAVVVPLRRPLATRVGDFSRWPLLLIDVTTEQGITGRSYLAPYLTSAAAGLRAVLVDLCAGLRGRPVAPAAAFEQAAHARTPPTYARTASAGAF